MRSASCYKAGRGRCRKPPAAPLTTIERGLDVDNIAYELGHIILIGSTAMAAFWAGAKAYERFGKLAGFIAGFGVLLACWEILYELGLKAL
jgi:hypothetical protein